MILVEKGQKLQQEHSNLNNQELQISYLLPSILNATAFAKAQKILLQLKI